MTIENNKKTEAIKVSLEIFLTQVENQKQMLAGKKSYIYIDDKIVPYDPREKAELFIIVTSTLGNLIKQFVSQDDLNSVKKLRETELLFLKIDSLSEFKFPDYKSQIHPTFLIYSDMDLQLDKLLKKAENLTSRGHNLAGIEAKSIVTLLRPLNHTFFKEKRIGYYDYRKQALNIINQGRTELEKHRGNKKILGNLIILILTLGTAFIINKAANGHFLFFQKTNSSEQLDRVTQTISQLHL
jgi:hypothetical protein